MTGQALRAPQPSAERIDWIDAARGIGILLVVYGHVMRGIVHAGMVPDTFAYRLTDTVIYAFHMPLFFVISGLLSRPVTPGRRWSFIRRRIEALVYPYFLWSIAQGLLTIAMNGSVNGPLTWSDMARIGWEPIAQFWFLYALFLVNLPLLLPRPPYLIAIVVVAATALAWWFGTSTIFLRACHDLLYLAIGVWITAPRLTRWLNHRPTASLVALLAWAGAALALACHVDPITGRWQGEAGWEYLPGMLGTVGTVALVRLGREWLRPLCLIGQASMAIYVLHTMASAAVRIALQKLAGPVSPLLLTISLTLIGTFVPYIIYRVASRMGMERILGLGHAPSRPLK